MIDVGVEISKGLKPLCGASFSVVHTMIYCHGGLTFIRHNKLRNLTASWLYKVCHDVAVEPPL